MKPSVAGPLEPGRLPRLVITHMHAGHLAFRVLPLLLIAIHASSAWPQTVSAQRKPNSADAWQIPVSTNLVPHFEQANGRKILYVDGKPFTALAVEIPWWDLIAGH